MSDGDSVRVAVRVRCFNQRERDRNAKLVIAMDGPQTRITNPDDPNDVRKFTFDYSYWSHDGYTVRPSDGMLVPDSTGGGAGHPTYADQRTVFNDLGADVLRNAYNGFNACLFAYGQTGSGKSYSMVGYNPNKGIVPIACDEIFKYIGTNSDPKKMFQVSVSMLEIYNEQVRDLLVKLDSNPRGGLKVRHHPQLGVQVVDLSSRNVRSYHEIEKAIDDGTKNRTIASTNMNATSSRAHTVVQILFTQIEKDAKGPGKDREMQSRINLVDLAGSERADSTGATGDRLKEGASINLSLTMLGNVINALAINSGNPKKKVLVPYRDSKLTMILQDALGGNSKTIMICALSPADINYDETLSTLRYADRAKQIKNKAIVNIDPTEQLIRQLREENEKLKLAFSGAPSDEPDAEKIKLEEQLRDQEAMMKEMQRAWEERLASISASTPSASAGKPGNNEFTSSNSLSSSSVNAESELRRKAKHISNLNEDEMLSGVLYFLVDSEGDHIVGQKGTDSEISLSGLGILKKHACFHSIGDNLFISVFDSESKTYVNGERVTSIYDEKNNNSKSMKQSTAAANYLQLHHNDRILFGNSHYYSVSIPSEMSDLESIDNRRITWDLANTEWATAQGYKTQNPEHPSDMSDEERQFAYVQDELVRLLPLVHEANGIAEELVKPVRFEAKIISDLSVMGGSKVSNLKRQSKVCVRMRSTVSPASWMWTSDKFMNRVFLMREMYQNHLENIPVTDFDVEKDPFWDPNEPQLIGKAAIYLNALACMVEIDDSFPIQDYKGKQEGLLHVSVFPCNSDGIPDEEGSVFVDDPKELIGKPANFLFTIKFARGLPERYKPGLFCKFSFMGQETLVTKTIAGTINPDFNYSKHISIPMVTRETVDYLENDILFVECWGSMDDKPFLPTGATMALLAKDMKPSPSLGPRSSSPTKIPAAHLTSSSSSSASSSSSLNVPKNQQRPSSTASTGGVGGEEESHVVTLNRVQRAQAALKHAVARSAWEHSIHQALYAKAETNFRILERKLQRLERSFVQAKANNEVRGKFRDELQTALGGRIFAKQQIRKIANTTKNSSPSKSKLSGKSETCSIQ